MTVAGAVWMVTVMVWDPPLAAMLDGEKLTVAPGGKPLTAKFTVPA